jgi:nicotinamidase-related amidase
MTTLANRPNAAVLVIDVQNDIMAHMHDRDRVIANIGTVVDKARGEDVPVIWVRHFDEDLPQDSKAWQCVPELARRESGPLVHKGYADAFEDSDLEARLAERGVGRLFVTGATTDVCIRATLHGAIIRGYDAILVGDAHSTEDHADEGAPTPDLVVVHTNLYWNYHLAPGRRAGTVQTAEVSFARP